MLYYDQSGGWMMFPDSDSRDYEVMADGCYTNT